MNIVLGKGEGKGLSADRGSTWQVISCEDRQIVLTFGSALVSLTNDERYLLANKITSSTKLIDRQTNVQKKVNQQSNAC